MTENRFTSRDHCGCRPRNPASLRSATERRPSHLQEFVDRYAAQDTRQFAGVNLREIAKRLPIEAALLVPDAFAAPFAFEKPNCLSLPGVEKLIGKLKWGGAPRAVKKAISLRCLSIVAHAPTLSHRRQKLKSEELSSRHPPARAGAPTRKFPKIKEYPLGGNAGGLPLSLRIMR
jgi:hypothetical protein